MSHPARGRLVEYLDTFSLLWDEKAGLWFAAYQMCVVSVNFVHGRSERSAAVLAVALTRPIALSYVAHYHAGETSAHDTGEERADNDKAPRSQGLPESPAQVYTKFIMI